MSEKAHLIKELDNPNQIAQTVNHLNRTTARDMAEADCTHADVLKSTNRCLLDDSQANIFLTAFYAVLDTSCGHLAHSNAAHYPPLYRRASSKKNAELIEHGMILGAGHDLHLGRQSIIVEHSDILKHSDILIGEQS